MIVRDQILDLAKKYQINESVVFREYLQTLFLSSFYSFPKSSLVFFKGGTALHLIYSSPRFSEDLDFTVELMEKDFVKLTKSVFDRLAREEDLEFKERKTVAGKRYLLVAQPSVLSYKTFINLDYSFREKVLEPRQSIIKTDYPILFNSFVYHLSEEEICAEKIRAIMTRKKGRDLYDLWYLFNKKVSLKNELVKEKLKYYGLEKVKNTEILKRIGDFSEKEFILDMRPFIPLPERAKLGSFLSYLKSYLTEALK